MEFRYTDALDFDYAAEAEATRARGERFLIAGNIPYHITSPLLMRIAESGAEFERMTLLMQREVAERIAVPHGGRASGAITIKLQYYCEVEPLFLVNRRAFLPPPQVDSQLVAFRRRSAPLPEDRRPRFFRLVEGPLLNGAKCCQMRWRPRDWDILNPRSRKRWLLLGDLQQLVPKSWGWRSSLRYSSASRLLVHEDSHPTCACHCAAGCARGVFCECVGPP